MKEYGGGWKYRCMGALIIRQTSRQESVCSGALNEERDKSESPVHGRKSVGVVRWKIAQKGVTSKKAEEGGKAFFRWKIGVAKEQGGARKRETTKG